MREMCNNHEGLRWLRASVLCCIVWVSVVAAAKAPDAKVELLYVPQQVIGGSSADLPEAIQNTPVDITLQDARKLSEATFLGVRTTDDNQKISLHSSGPIEPFVENILINDARTWGATVSVDAKWRMNVELLKFEVTETNQAVGAMYQAETKARLTLREPTGRAVWSATTAGDATRYGRKYSNRNINEVLSDAVREAFASALDEPTLHSIWGAQTSLTVREAGRRQPGPKNLSPEELLSQLQQLQDKGFETATLNLFIDQTRLTRSFTASDLEAWQAAGLEESLLQRALRLATQDE